MQDTGQSIPIDANEMAAYLATASSEGNKWKIEATIYTNSSSPAAVPTFGNLMLESIAKTMTEKPKLKLSFKYTLW